MSHFSERQALEMTLQSLLDLRSSLRREYVDRDKELGDEIKQFLKRIRELDEQFGAPVWDRKEVAERKSDLLQPVKLPVGERRSYQNHDYPEIAKEIVHILEEAERPLTLDELYKEMQRRNGVNWSSPYIIVHKALKHTDRVGIEKLGRKLRFSLQNQLSNA